MKNTTTKLHTFSTRSKAKQFMKVNENVTFRDMNTAEAKVRNQRWQVLETVEVSTKAEVVSPTVVVKPKTATKADQVRDIVKSMSGQEGIRTKDIISVIMEKVGFKYRAASTYYYNAKRAIAK